MGTRPTTKALIAALAITALALADAAFAAAGEGGGLPWEAPGVLLVNSITGPWAFFAAVFGLTGGIATLAFTDNISSLTRYMVYFVLVISMLVSVVNLMQVLFGVGATASGSLGTLQIGAAVFLIALAAVLARVQLVLVERLVRP